MPVQQCQRGVAMPVCTHQHFMMDPRSPAPLGLEAETAMDNTRYNTRYNLLSSS